MVFHYNRILSAKGKTVHVWMNCVPLDLAQFLRIGSYWEGMSWIVGRLLFFLFLTQTGVDKEMWLLLNNTFVLLRWEVLKTFSLSVTKDPALILEYFVLYWLHSAFDEIMSCEIIRWTESHHDSHNRKHTEILLGMKAERF